MKKFIPNSTFINESANTTDFFVVYDSDRFVSHITSKSNEINIKKFGFKTGHELNVAEKRKAVYFADRHVNYGIYARNQEGEPYYGEEIGEVAINLKGLKLLNITYKDENGKYVNYKKYNNFVVRGELDSIPYDIDGAISYLENGDIYEVALKKDVANKQLKKMK